MTISVGRAMVLGATVLASTILATGAWAGSRYEACPPADYALHHSLTGGAAAGAALLRIGRDALISIDGLCLPTTGKVRGTKKGTTVKATWRGCPGAPGRLMRLKGLIDTSCGTFTGTWTTIDPKGTRSITGTKPQGDALRIGTWNVQFLPGIYSRNGSPCNLSGDDDIVRPPAIAHGVIRSKYDVIAFNEVFDENAQDGLEKALKATYPYYIKYLHPGDSYELEDSGLQIFSRFPFEPIPNPVLVDPDDAEGTDPDKVAAWEFTEYECDGDDCMASKGAALVRVRHPENGRILNVVFTHMQSSYPTEDEDLADAQEHVWSRELQLVRIRQVLEKSLTPDQLAREDVFVMGDVNIDGDPADLDLGHDHVDIQNLYEWNQRFNNPAFLDGFFTTYLRDTWHLQNLPMAVEKKDRGLTNYKVPWSNDADSGARLDYILWHSTPDPSTGAAGLCPQHMYKAHHLKYGPPFSESAIGEPGTDAGSCELSDHIGLTLDLNAMAAHCQPATAQEHAVQPGQQATLTGTLAYEGAMQWYRFDTPGTYGFALDSEPDGTEDDVLHFQVYESTDLSTPVLQYKSKTMRIDHAIGKKFVMPDAPFYVKVFDPDRTFTGPYRLYARQAGCRSKDDACVLSVGTPETGAFPAGQPLNAEDAAWYELDTESTGGIGPQQLDFVIDDYSQDFLSLALLAADGATVLDEDLAAEPSSPPGTWKLQVLRQEENAETYYLLVRRSPAANLEAISYRTSWTTNLALFVGAKLGGSKAAALQLHVSITSDDLGSDDIYVTVYADGKQVLSEHFVAYLANNDFASLEWLPQPIRYFNEVELVFREDDDNEDDEFRITIPSSGWSGRCKFERKSPVPQTKGTDGIWWLFYNTCHGLQSQ